MENLQYRQSKFQFLRFISKASLKFKNLYKKAHFDVEIQQVVAARFGLYKGNHLWRAQFRVRGRRERSRVWIHKSTY